MPKCPYTYPHKSRKAMTEYLAEHESYYPMNSWNRGFCLSWNVKVYSCDMTGKSGSNKVEDRFNAAWDKYQENYENNVFFDACADAASYLTDGDYTTYPGDDQGNYKFAFNGRSGGHLILTECGFVPAPRAWKLFPMIWESRDHYHEWLASLKLDTLKQFYKAIRCMDADFSRDSVKRNVNEAINYLRSSKEDEWQNELEEIEAELKETRETLLAMLAERRAACKIMGAGHFSQLLKTIRDAVQRLLSQRQARMLERAELLGEA